MYSRKSLHFPPFEQLQNVKSVSVQFQCKTCKSFKMLWLPTNSTIAYRILQYRILQYCIWKITTLYIAYNAYLIKWILRDGILQWDHISLLPIGLSPPCQPSATIANLSACNTFGCPLPSPHHHHHRHHHDIANLSTCNIFKPRSLSSSIWSNTL